MSQEIFRNAWPPITYAEVHVVEVHLAKLVPQASHVYDNRSLSANDALFEQKICEEEVAKVVCGELTLDPVFGCRVGPRRHNSSIINEAVDLAANALDRVDCCFDGRVVKEVDIQEDCLNTRVDSSNGLYHRSDLCLIAGRQNEQFRLRRGERGSYLRANALVTGAGDKIFGQIVNCLL
jgi:hypothetical protein